MLKRAILIILVFLWGANIFAQKQKSALNILRVAPDARSSGMGDIGVASSPDQNSQHWNAAKYIFANNTAEIGLSYTPWLKGATNDIKMLYLSGFSQIGDKQALGASLRFFTLGQIDLYNEDSNFLMAAKPNEFAFDISYSRRLSKYSSAAVTFRYINSSKVGMQNFNPIIEHVSNIAADIAFYWQKPIYFSFAKKSELAFGLNISNLGTKLKVSDAISYFLPMTISLGSRISFGIDDYNSLSAILELNKSLVPSHWDNNNASTLSAAAKGFLSDFAETSVGFGLEYAINNMFFVRTGYRHHAPNTGETSYINLGLGLNYKTWGLAASYLFTTKGRNTIINNTYRLSLSIALSGNKNSNYFDYDL